MSCFTTPICRKRLPGECVYYSGSFLSESDINDGDSLNTVVQKLNSAIGTGSGGSETPNSKTDSNSITLTLSGTYNRNIQANLRRDAEPDNKIEISVDGVYVPPASFSGEYTGGELVLTVDETTLNIPIEVVGGVTSVFGRTGVVVKQAGDYDFGDLGSTPDTIAGYGITDAYTKTESDTLYYSVTNPDGYITSADLPDLSGYALIDGSNVTSPWTLDIVGNSSTATSLETARTINGVSFDGTGDITIVDATKEPIIAAGTTVQYWRGDKTWVTLNTTAVAEGSNLYYTDVRARAALDSEGLIQYNPTTGMMGLFINAGANITLSGAGSSASPLVINSSISGGGGENVLTFNTPLQRSGDIITILQAGSGQSGYLSAADWNYFSSTSFLRTTIATLRAETTPSTTQPYYITDKFKEGFFYYDSTDTTSADNEGTILVTADGKRFKREQTDIIDVKWFGGVPDFVTGTGNSIFLGTGTDNTPAATAAAIAAKNGQTILFDASGSWYFADDVVFNNSSNIVRKFNVKVEGSAIFDIGHGFVIHGMYNTFESIGGIYSKNMGSGEDYDDYEGIGVYMRNLYNSTVVVNVIQGFKVGAMFGADSSFTSGNAVGNQYNSFHYKKISQCDKQIQFATFGVANSLGNWVNENTIWGGQLGGGVTGAGGNYGIYMIKGDDTQQFKYEGHKFYNTGLEGLENGIYMEYAQINDFFSGRFEEGAVTNKIYLETTVGNSCVNNRFHGWSLKESYFIEAGIGTVLTGCKVYSEGGTIVGEGLSLSATDSGRFIHFVGKYPGAGGWNEIINDAICFSGHTTPLRTFSRSKINGVDRYLEYNRVYQSITASGPLTEGVTYLRANMASGAIVATITPANLLDGTQIFLEVANISNPFSIVRSDSSAVLLAAGTVSSAGRWILTYVNTNGVFRADKLGAGGGGGGTTLSLGVVGSAPNTSGATYDDGSGLLVLQPADGTRPGILTAGPQVIGGQKIFAPTITSGALIGTIINPNITATSTGATMYGLDIQGTYNTGGYTGTVVYGLKTPSIMLSTDGMANVSMHSSAVGMSYLLRNPMPTGNYATYSFGSGFNTKDCYLLIGKSGVTSMGVVNNGSNMLLVTENNTSGFIFRKNVGFTSPDFTTDAFTGTNLMQMFSSGNLLVQTAGTYIDNGFKLDVQGTGRFTGLLRLASFTTDPSGANGDIYYNPTLGKFRGYQAGAWVDLVGSGGGGGGGDFSTSTSSSTDGEVVVYSGTGGKTGKRSNTLTGVAKLSAGVLSAGTVNLATEVSGNLAVARLNSGTGASSTTFWRGDGTWAVPPGGTGGGGVTSLTTVGGTPNGNGGTISGTVLQLHPASSSQPGVLTAGTQTIGGLKTYALTVTFRAGSNAAGTAPLKLPVSSGLMSSPEAGALEHFGGQLWFTDQFGNRYALAGPSNNMIFTNKTWNGQWISEAVGGTDDWEARDATVMLSSAAGSGASFVSSYNNSASRGVISFSTGASPTTGDLASVVITGASSTREFAIVISAGNPAAARVMNRVFAYRLSGTTWLLSVVDTALITSTTYTFHYHVKRLNSTSA